LTGQSWGGSVIFLGDDLSVVKTKGGVTDVAWVSDSAVVASSEDCNIYLIAKEGIMTTFSDHEDFVTSITFANDLLVSASWDLTLKVWSLKDKIPKSSLIGHHNSITCVRLSPHKKGAFASAAMDGTVLLWQDGTDKSTGTIAVDAFTVEWLPDGNTLALGSEAGSLAFYDVRNLSKPTAQHQFESSIYSLRANSKYIAVGLEDGSVSLTDVSTDSIKVLGTSKHHTDLVRGLAWDSKGQLASGSWDNFIKVYTPSLTEK